MALHKIFNKLCTPARFYLGLSIFVTVLMVVQNFLNKNPDELCVGAYKCNLNSPRFFLFKVLYVVFWTWLLNLLCQHGLKSVSWFLVLIPFLLLAVGIGLIIGMEIDDLVHDQNKQNKHKHQNQNKHKHQNQN